MATEYMVQVKVELTYTLKVTAETRDEAETLACNEAQEHYLDKEPECTDATAVWINK